MQERREYLAQRHQEAIQRHAKERREIEAQAAANVAKCTAAHQIATREDRFRQQTAERKAKSPNNAHLAQHLAHMFPA